MNIVFMGTPKFSVPILKSLIEKYGVSLVVTKPDTYTGRKRELTYSEVKKVALEYGIDIFQPERIKDDYQKVLDYQPDIIITAAFGEFIPEELINYPKYGCINVHGSLLPKYRGGSPVQSAIINGEKETGITIMYMVKKMDAGNIISQRSVEITDDDTNTTLFEKMSYVGAELLLETLPLIFEGKNQSIEQNEEEATFAYNIKHEEQFIDWNDSSVNIVNKIRGLADEPSALTLINGEMVKIFKAEAKDYVGEEAPGTVLCVNKELIIKTKDGAVSIKDLQLSGKKRMDVKSFLNGQKVFVVGCLVRSNVI